MPESSTLCQALGGLLIGDGSNFAFASGQDLPKTLDGLVESSRQVTGRISEVSAAIGEQAIVDLQGARFAVTAVAQFGQRAVTTLKVAR